MSAQQPLVSALTALAALALLAASTGACDTDDGPGELTIAPGCVIEPTIDSIEEHYFDKSCVFATSCHGPRAEGELSLEIGESYAQLVGDGTGVDSDFEGAPKRVIPGDIDGSFIVQKVLGTFATGQGVMMPLGSTSPVSEDCGIAAMQIWIREGAAP